MEHYSVIKRKQTVPFPTTRMNLKDIMTSEVSQTQKNAVIPFICEILKS